MADGTLIFDTKVNEEGFKKGANSVRKQGTALEKNFEKLGKQLKKYFGLAALVSFAKKSIDFASDIEEVQNVVDTAFGSMSDKMEKFAEHSITAFGMSKLTAKQTGSTFMAMARGMDIAEESASDMALQLTALTGDMASFYNKSQDVASTALKSVFTGETETLKQFGIVMTETNLETFRMSEGIKTAYKDMTQAQKVQLRYNYVLKQTAMVQGDFQKTQKSWANQTRILGENFKELMSLIGTGLIQVLTPVVQLLNIAIKEMIEFGNAISKMFGGGNVSSQEKQTEAVNKTVKAEQKLGQTIKENDKANKKSLAGFDTIMKLSEKASDSAGAGGSGEDIAINTPYDFSNLGEVDTSGVESKINNINLLLERLKGNISEIGAYFEQFSIPFKKWFKIDVSSLGKSFVGLMKTVFTEGIDIGKMVLDDFINKFLPTILNTMFTVVLPILTQLLTEIINTLSTLFSTISGMFKLVYETGIRPYVDLLVKIWTGLWDTIYKNWQKWGEPIFNNLRKAITNTGETFEHIWNDVLEPVWSNFMDAVDWLWEEHLQPFVDNFLDFVFTIIDGGISIYNGFILPLINWFVDKLGPAIVGVVNLIVNILGTVIGTITDIASGIITSLKGIINFIVGVFTGDWERAWSGISQFFDGIWQGIVGIVKGCINLIIDFINGMIYAVRTAINYLIDGLNKLSFDAPDWVEEKFGIESFGFNIKPIPEIKIPKLATGTVVPANNGEFLAMLGDNKRETEVVSPLSTMKQAFREVMQEFGGQEVNADVHIYWNGEEIYEQVEKVRSRRGTRLVKGGI